MLGKTKSDHLNAGIREYEKRLSRYTRIDPVILPTPKHASKLSPAELKEAEADIISSRLKNPDYLILLDERGKTMDSRGFAALLEKRFQHSGQQTIFLIGGAYGFADRIYERANQKLSLSQMTFSHQLIRLIFWEQLYRGISIIHGLPYHND